MQSLTVKKRAKNHWLDVYELLASELDEACGNVGDHVPCPFKEHVNSVDGFRLFDDANETGGGVCNSCGTFSDGFSLLMHLKAWSFEKTLSEVSECLEQLDIPLDEVTQEEKKQAMDIRTINQICDYVEKLDSTRKAA